ncbi:MAG: hypothetical protein CVT49_01710 [candidate division Zixibacteria bacterium HGW-Zixibacteria-1]|nr:MAG: hypothetical protein CVT49_01710 [candidate division Zixibacteria bacterium HGW-Zixibacteria-1]
MSIRILQRVTILISCLVVISGLVADGLYAQCIQPPSNMLAWWPGDIHSRDLVSRKTALWHGTPGYITGMVDQAFDFDGNSYLEVPEESASLEIDESSFSIDLWFQYGYQGGLVSRYDPQSHLGYELSITQIVGPAPWQLVFTINGTSYSGDLPDPSSGWIHAVVVVNKSAQNGGIIYINNQIMAYFDAQSVQSVSSNVSFKIGTNSFDNRHQGPIDEVEVFKRALDASEVAALYNAGSDGKCKDVQFQVPVTNNVGLIILVTLLAAAAIIVIGRRRAITIS